MATRVRFGPLDTSTKKAPAGLANHPITIRALYGRHEEGVAILEFPTIEAAKAWYDNPAYREVRQHRLKGGNYRAVIRWSSYKSGFPESRQR